MEKDLVKYLIGTAKALRTLAGEVGREGFDKEKEDLMCKIGADLLFHAKTFTYRASEASTQTQ